MRKALVIGGYAAAGIVFLALPVPWYSTPRYCIELAGFSCPQSQQLEADLQLALIAATVGFVALLTLASASRLRSAYFPLVASAVAVACVVGYGAARKPDVRFALSVDLAAGFFVAAAATAAMLALSIALALGAARR